MSKSNCRSRSKWLKMILPLIMIFSVFAIVNPSTVHAANISADKSTYQPAGEFDHPDDVYLIGQDVYYSIEVQNTDENENSIVEIRDTDPSGVEWWYDFELGEWVLNRPDEDTTIAPGETWEGTFEYTVEEDALFEGEDGRNRIRNAFTAIGTQGDEEIEVRVTKTSFVIQPEITVDKSVSHDTSKVGDTVTYTIEITNTGDWALEDVTVIDSLLGDISDDFTDTLGVGESDSEEFDYEIPDQEDALNLVNEVEVSGTAEDFDPQIEGAVVTAEDEVEVSLVYPEISIQKEADREVAKLDSVINYTVTVTNEGDVDMEVVVDDTIGGVLFDDDLEAGESEVFNYSHTVTEECVEEGVVENTATATGTLDWLDLDNIIGPVEASFDVQIVEPAIEITKEANRENVKLDSTITYTITIENIGDFDLEDVVVTDDMFDIPEEAFSGTLDEGESASYSYDYEVSATDVSAGEIVNTAEVESTPAGDMDNEITAQDSVTVTTLDPAISIEKEADREVAKLDSVINYTVTVTNEGDVDMEVVVNDTLVEGELFDGIIDVGAFEEFTYSYTVTQEDVDTGSVTNTATAIATLEWLELDNEYEVEATVEVDMVTPEIQITKTADPTEGYVGDEITYTICIENIGDYDLENVVVNDPMLGGVLEGFPGTLVEGTDPVCVDFEYTISEDDLSGLIENTAEVYANPVGMDNEITDDDDAVVNVLVEDLSVTKTAETSFNRTHEWDIDKEVTTEYGHTIGEDEDPKIRLYEDGSGDETATWEVCVTYEGFEDSEHNVSGEISIENTGNVPAEITEIKDLLGGEDISDNIVWDWPGDSDLPYILPVDDTLTGTYDEQGYFEGKNIVTVTTERDDYEVDADIVWDEPDEKYLDEITIEDVSDLLGTQDLGTLDAANLNEGETTCFEYEYSFAWTDYNEVGPHIYDNTATIVETGQIASATLIINWEPPDEVCWGDDTAWAYGGEYAEPNWNHVNNRNWGWTNGPLEEGSSYEWEIYAGAGQNILENGYVVGTLYVDYDEGCVEVVYEMDEGYYLDETHLWVGSTELPEVSRGRTTVMTSAPGQFPNGTNYGFDPDDLDTWEIDWSFEECGFEGEIYIAAHAVVWMEVECEEE